MAKIIVTGGAGYIGSHMCVELLQAGYDVVVVDNLSNSSPKSLAKVQQITQKKLQFVEADLRDGDSMRDIFEKHDIAAVLHFAGLKAVGDSTRNPITYYDNNVNGTLCLLKAMQDAEVKTLVFSSSATVYGIPEVVPVREATSTRPINPYGKTKLHIEEMLKDLWLADREWRISLLRYFNPVGAHPSGEIGEDSDGIPNNLLPFIGQVAVGNLPYIEVFGDDYPTADGTGIRDYIHILDLVSAHRCALKFLEHEPKLAIHNIGTGKGYSVFEILKAFESACGKTIPYRVIGRRPGDAAVVYADPRKANEELKWHAKYDIDRMCTDAWRWQSHHPSGYN